LHIDVCKWKYRHFGGEIVIINVHRVVQILVALAVIVALVFGIVLLVGGMPLINIFDENRVIWGVATVCAIIALLIPNEKRSPKVKNMQDIQLIQESQEIHESQEVQESQQVQEGQEMQEIQCYQKVDLDDEVQPNQEI